VTRVEVEVGFDKRAPFPERSGRPCPRLAGKLGAGASAGMPRVRNVVSAWRVLAVWLLTLCVCFGPGRFGTSAAFAASSSCGASCHCEQAAEAAHAATHAGEREVVDPCAGEHANYHQGDPCSHDCSETCPTCACCLGAAMAVLPSAITSHRLSWSKARMFVTLDAPALGARVRVFRPPRSVG